MQIKSKKIAALLVCLLLMGAASRSFAAAESEAGVPYLLDTCPVTGAKLGSMGEPVITVYEGREVRFCCAGCIPAFENDKTGFFQKIDAVLVEKQKPFYPLEACVISGEKLASQDTPVDYIFGAQLVRFCCPDCVETFKQNTEGNINKIKAAVIEKQSSSYPSENCVVSGNKLGGMGEPVDYVLGSRLVRLCCKGCINELQKNPLKYLGMLDQLGKNG
jgi:YHS domain-containing protein